MKVAFVSDTHFGYSRFEQDAQAQGESAILDACSKADVLLLGGDIFDQRIPKMETLASTAILLQTAQKMLPNNGFAKILGIHGTHESRSKDALNPIALMAKLGLMEDVHNRTIVLEKKSSDNSTEKIAISGLGGIPDDLVKEALPRLSCKPIPDAQNFFLFHQTMQEYVPQAKGLASLEDLPAGYDWYLCGHIHSKKEFMNKKLLIPGSTVLTQQKDEEQSQKGYFLIDTKTKQADFIQIKVRPFHVSELEFENASAVNVRIAVQKELENLLQKQWEAKPILKIRLKGSLKKGSSDLDLSDITTEKAILSLDNRLDGNSLLDEIAQLKEERLTRATPLQLGMSILRVNAKRAGMSEERAMQYFEKYSND
ncbi:MAG: metallophosphoesterase [Candidatus Micrarchaeia archaeon]